MSWCAGLANTLVRLAKGAASRSEKLQTRIDRRGRGHNGDLITELALARREEAQACWLARDIRMLTQWLNHDVLALAGPVLATRQVLFDFIVDELTRREPEDRHRIRPVRIALQLFSLPGVLDEKLAAIACIHQVSDSLVREACVLHRLPTTSSSYWRDWNRLRRKSGDRFHDLFTAVNGFCQRSCH